MEIEQKQIRFLAFECCKCKNPVRLEGLRLTFIGSETVKRMRFEQILKELGINKI